MNDSNNPSMDSEWNFANSYFYRIHEALVASNRASAMHDWQSQFDALFIVHRELVAQMSSEYFQPSKKNEEAVIAERDSLEKEADKLNTGELNRWLSIIEEAATIDTKAKLFGVKQKDYLKEAIDETVNLLNKYNK